MTRARTWRAAAALAAVVLAGAALLAAALGDAGGAARGRRVIVVGIDGLDPRFLRRFMDEGRLPHFERLATDGAFTELETTMPPLSPVAWSTFITGLDPGGHGIYDFLHRDPDTMEPFDAIYQVAPPGRRIALGSWVLPLTGGDVVLQRAGRAFWELLEDAGVDTTIFRMPVNFPPVHSAGRSLSGMGTPDILGTHGTFSFYTDDPPPNADDLTGGVVRRVEVVDDRVAARLIGPPNTFRRFPVETARRGGGAAGDGYEHPDLAVDFEVLLDPDAPAAKLVVQDQEFVLNAGEWSDWIAIEFEAVPLLVEVSATARFYLQEVRPGFKLYVSPLQIDPRRPALPISTPDHWSGRVADAVGRFYTQELPEDTKAFQEGIFSGHEFWRQAQFVYRERRRALDHLLEAFDEGLLFFYFSSVDQGMHMLYHYLDDAHPLFEADELLARGVRTLYEEMDEALGRVFEFVDGETTLIVMSDHGFSPFYWGVNLNTWLLEQGYVTLRDPARQGVLPLFLNVDWSRTTAYAVGLQGLYVNLRGREAHGIVEPGAEYARLLDRLEADLLAMRDERNGRAPVRLAFRPRDAWRGPHLEQAPDIVVGYDRGYRSSWDSPLGQFPHGVYVDNDETWSGDHAIDYRLVPGVLLTNRRIALEAPALQDLTVAVLDEFGVAPLPEMIGRDALD